MLQDANTFGSRGIVNYTTLNRYGRQKGRGDNASDLVELLSKVSQVETSLYDGQRIDRESLNELTVQFELLLQNPSAWSSPSRRG